MALISKFVAYLANRADRSATCGRRLAYPAMTTIAMLTLCVSTRAADSPRKSGEWKLTPQQASLFAKLALKGIQKEYPNKPGDVLNAAADVIAPRSMHP